VNDARVYLYRDAINGFFEFPTEAARAILPRGIQPVEPHHGQSILAVTGFEFHQSPVGEYRELTLSVLVAPRLAPHQPMPRAALYPFMVGTTTQASRLHGSEVWHLPHHPKELEIDLVRGDGEIRLAAREGTAILELVVTVDAGWEQVEHRYQTFMNDDQGAYLSELTMAGPFMEHEEERGSLVLHRHPFTAALDPPSIATAPFREQWMKQGRESIFPLQTLVSAVAR
jgi:hypothetical protein